MNHRNAVAFTTGLGKKDSIRCRIKRHSLNMTMRILIRQGEGPVGVRPNVPGIPLSVFRSHEILHVVRPNVIGIRIRVRSETTVDFVWIVAVDATARPWLSIQRRVVRPVAVARNTRTCAAKKERGLRTRHEYRSNDLGHHVVQEIDGRGVVPRA